MSHEHNTTPGSPADEGQPGHEPNTFSVRTAVIALSGVVVVSVVTFAIMIAFYHGLANPVEQRDADESASTLLQASPEQVEPRLTRGGPSQLNALREAAHETLDSYAWVDQQAGIARVPISQAMEMIIQEGLPTQGKRGTGEGEAETRSPTPEDDKRESNSVD